MAGMHYQAIFVDVCFDCVIITVDRCQLEAGTAFCFHILESRATGWLGGTRSCRFSLQAPSVEDCCEWVVAIREAIAVASGKALHYQDTYN
jgi:hypothetical protein